LVVLNPTLLHLFLDGEIQNPNDFKGFSIARSEGKNLVKFARFFIFGF
jgi:hypothetical protein